MPSVGHRYLGRVTEVQPHVVRVELEGGHRAELHVTRISPRGLRLRSAVGVLNVGDHLLVTVAEVNEQRGVIGLNLDAKLDGDREITPDELIGDEPVDGLRS
jgi:ribosomal protein S1